MAGAHVKTARGNKLNASEAWAILMAPAHKVDSAYTTARIAKAYGVSTSTVTDIRNGRSWKNLRTQKKPFAADAECMWLQIEVYNLAGLVQYKRA